MGPVIRNFASEVAWRLPAQPGAASNGPVTLVYHGIPRTPDSQGFRAEDFEAQIRFLKEHFDFVSPDALYTPAEDRGRIRVLLTFDDGFRNNAEIAAPVLERYRIPAVFFVATRHLQPREYLWFAYLRALGVHFPGKSFAFRGAHIDMSAERRQETMAQLRRDLLALRPHPAKLYEVIAEELPAIDSFTSPEILLDHYAGMTATQLQRLAANPLFTIGGHTVDHPMLASCERKEARRQMEMGRDTLSQLTGKACGLFAYPSDDHDQEVRDMCENLGFRTAFTIHRTAREKRHLSSPRVGVYYPSLPELGFKVQWNGLLRRIQQWSTKF